ncbi:NAD(P)/FAD-dependent oxidoreductase [Desulfovibrio sp. OttesenSCG-928-C06]|nr:NAD(P)/FAD-dependent oxidoreductase [Desulfovibrio sp. OttesenSCG-928-C06]
MTYDLIVIGAGAGGREAAILANANGLKTMLVESCFIGGTCVNSGCIPTKFLLGSTASGHLFAVQKKTKAAEGEIFFNLAQIQEKKDRYIKALRSSIEKSVQTLGIELVYGSASFKDANTISINTKENEVREVSFKNCIVATGSVPAKFPGVSPDGGNVLSSSSALNLKEAPESMIIVGGGVIGLEMGDFYKRLGTKITLVEIMDRIALSEDAEVSAALAKQLTREGWQIHTGRKIKEVVSECEGAVLRFEDGEELTASKALIAVGRQPGSKGLEAEKAGIKLFGPGWIETDEYLLAAPGIYAIGDANKRVLLAHAAEHQAHYAVAHILGRETGAYNGEPMPSCIYGNNEIMHVGPHTDQLLKEFKPQGKEVAVSYSQLVANPIAQSYGCNQGWIKVAWVDGKVYSVAGWGHGVSHLVTPATIMVQQHWDKNQIIFAHPTLEESLKSALLAEKEIL